MTIELQQRDIDVLNFIFKHRAVTFDQIRRHFFSERSVSTICRRLRRLYKENFLSQGWTMRNGSSAIYYSSTEQGFNEIKATWNFEMDKPHFKSESIDHDIRVAELGLRFSRLKRFKSFTPENVLQSSSSLESHERFGELVKLQTDAGLMMVGDDKKEHLFAIEMEINSKGVARYVKKLQDYYLTRSIVNVIYVCSNQSIVHCLEKADAEVRGKDESILYFGLEEKTLNSLAEITFHNPKREVLILR